MGKHGTKEMGCPYGTWDVPPVPPVAHHIYMGQCIMGQPMGYMAFCFIL